MFSASRKKMVIVTLCAVIFTAGLVKLFWLRFEAGDLYPPYSSLRGDPLGAQVLYESLQIVHPDGVTRNFRPLDQVNVTADSTLLVCGLPNLDSLGKEKMWEKLLSRIEAQGGRLVITISSTAHDIRSKRVEDNPCDDDADIPSSDTEDCKTEENKPPAATDEEKKSDEDKKDSLNEDDDAWIGVLATLGLSIQRINENTFADFAEKPSYDADDLPSSIPYRSPLYFQLDDPAWQSVYQWENEPVVVLRPWGAGSIVMTTDSYLFSNEALRKDRSSELLTWYLQPQHQIIFDEFHNGLAKQPGIANLMRKYRLHGVLASLAVLLVLILWRQTAVFVVRPADVTEKEDAIFAGTETADGMVGLMQRHIPPNDLLKVCFEAWNASAASGRVLDDRKSQIGNIVADYGDHRRRKDVVAYYKQICELLKRGKVS